MGTLTTNLQLYKPAATEFVDVETQLNRNWDIADSAVKRLLEYEFTPLQTPDLTNVVNRSHFYKSYSNSFWAYFKTTNLWWQDPKARVSSWVSAASLLQSGWFELPDMPLYYRIIKNTGSSTTEIEWTGAVCNQVPDPVTIDVNTNMFIIDTGGLPASIRPTVSKYFTMFAGNTSTNYSISRLFFSSAGNVEIKRYGSNPTSPGTENRIEFTGVKYNLEVAA